VPFEASGYSRVRDVPYAAAARLAYAFSLPTLKVIYPATGALVELRQLVFDVDLVEGIIWATLTVGYIGRTLLAGARSLYDASMQLAMQQEGHALRVASSLYGGVTDVVGALAAELLSQRDTDVAGALDAEFPSQRDGDEELEQSSGANESDVWSTLSLADRLPALRPHDSDTQKNFG